MPSSSTVEPIHPDRAEYLKEKIREFATEGPLKNHYEQHHNLFASPSETADEIEIESVLDSFLFDWIDDYSASVIDYFLEYARGLSDSEQSVLVEWKDSITAYSRSNRSTKTLFDCGTWTTETILLSCCPDPSTIPRSSEDNVWQPGCCL